MRDYYFILCVDPNATSDHIKISYETLSTAYSPNQDETSKKVFEDINEAYEVLSDPDKRKEYDESFYLMLYNSVDLSYSVKKYNSEVKQYRDEIESLRVLVKQRTYWIILSIVFVIFLFDQFYFKILPKGMSYVVSFLIVGGVFYIKGMNKKKVPNPSLT